MTLRRLTRSTSTPNVSCARNLNILYILYTISEKIKHEKNLDAPQVCRARDVQITTRQCGLRASKNTGKTIVMPALTRELQRTATIQRGLRETPQTKKKKEVDMIQGSTITIGESCRRSCDLPSTTPPPPTDIPSCHTPARLARHDDGSGPMVYRRQTAHLACERDRVVVIVSDRVFDVDSEADRDGEALDGDREGVKCVGVTL